MAARKTATKNFTVFVGGYVRPETKQMFDRVVEARDISSSALLREALDAYLEANQVPAKVKPRKTLKRTLKRD
jgi:hypothetical protein